MVAIRRLSAEEAQQIVSWRYPPPYDLYDMAGVEVSEAARAGIAGWLLDPDSGYFAIVEEMGAELAEDTGPLLGFCCYGREGQVPGYDYGQVDALDVGLGLHPEKIGQGRGRAVMAAILAFGRRQYRPPRWRATVASFNRRSQQLCRNAGFRPVAEFVSTTADPRPFVVLVLPEPDTNVKPPSSQGGIP